MTIPPTRRNLSTEAELTSEQQLMKNLGMQSTRGVGSHYGVVLKAKPHARPEIISAVAESPMRVNTEMGLSREIDISSRHCLRPAYFPLTLNEHPFDECRIEIVVEVSIQQICVLLESRQDGQSPVEGCHYRRCFHRNSLSIHLQIHPLRHIRLWS